MLGVSDGMVWVKGAVTGRKRIARHLTNMLAGTIATITAVLVVNVATDPSWIAPFIIYWDRRPLRPEG